MFLELSDLFILKGHKSMFFNYISLFILHFTLFLMFFLLYVLVSQWPPLRFYLHIEAQAKWCLFEFSDIFILNINALLIRLICVWSDWCFVHTHRNSIMVLLIRPICVFPASLLDWSLVSLINMIIFFAIRFAVPRRGMSYACDDSCFVHASSFNYIHS